METYVAKIRVNNQGRNDESTCEVYLRADVDAEIARLKNELDVALKLAGHTAPSLNAKIRECDLLKAALRWATRSPVLSLEDVTGIVYDVESGRDAKVPPEFAAVIAEAVKS